MATQPGTALAAFNPGAVPAHIAHFYEEEGANVSARQTVNSLSPEGKVWTLAINGQRQPLQVRNTDGDLTPLPIFKAVVLNFSQQRGRAYYEGTYDPNNVSAPICWSDDGVKPDDSLPGPYTAQQVADLKIDPKSSRKISDACTSCPMAVKGSKVTDNGKSTTACGVHRMLALVPDPQLGLPKDTPPLRLKIAVTSDWDKQSPEQEQQGWLAWSNYVDWLNARGVKHTATVVTKMKFDPAAAYPKIFFSAERHLEADELAVLGPLVKADETLKLLGGTWTPAGVDGIRKEEQQVAAPEAQPAAAAAPAPAAPAPAAVGETTQGEVEYEMADGEAHTREEYLSGGWTDQQLIENGKMRIKQPAAPTPLPPSAAVAPPPPAAEPAAAIVLGEPAAGTPSAAPATTEGSGAASAIVLEPTPAPPAGASQTVVPPPAAKPVADPPKAAEKAAEVTPDVSAEVPEDVADLLQQWGPEATPA